MYNKAAWQELIARVESGVVIFSYTDFGAYFIVMGCNSYVFFC